jgi:hypothetical protein
VPPYFSSYLSQDIHIYCGEFTAFWGNFMYFFGEFSGIFKRKCLGDFFYYNLEFLGDFFHFELATLVLVHILAVTFDR